MGTRHLICVVENNEYKVANYGQWDGYPAGQGAEILKFLKESFDKELFKEKVKNIKTISNEELNERYMECGAKEGATWVSMDVADAMKSQYLQLTRDCGSNILPIIQNSPAGLKLLSPLLDFATSGSCEWLYVVDLDKETLEVFSWLNDNRLNKDDRFFFLQDDVETGIQLVKSFNLNKLPSEKSFLLKIDKIVNPENYVNVEPEVKEPPKPSNYIKLL